MPRVVDHQQRRREVGRAAAAVIGRSGLDGATFREIAAEMDSSTGTLNHYFRDKDDVLLSALRYCADVTTERVLAALGGPDAAAALRAVLLAALPVDADSRREWAVWIAFWARGVSDPGFQAEHQARYLEWQLAVELAVSAARDAGQIAAGTELGAAATRLIAIVDGLGIRAMLDPGGFGPHRIGQLIDAEIAALR